MFEQLVDPQFVIKEKMVAGETVMLSWDMNIGMGCRQWRRVQAIRGPRHPCPSNDGSGATHRACRDTGEDPYSRLPLIGAAVLFVRRRMV